MIYSTILEYIITYEFSNKNWHHSTTILYLENDKFKNALRNLLYRLDIHAKYAVDNVMFKSIHKTK